MACLALLGWLGVDVGCSDAEQKAPDAGVEVGAGVPADPNCPSLPSGVSGSPRTIPQTVDLVNALLVAGAAPLTLPCFVQRLDRPLAIMGVNSVFSAQPADGPRNPRIFTFFGNNGNNDLILSVAPAGSASDRIELAEYPMPLESIKAEIAFPVVATLPLAVPYDRIRLGVGTVCGVCHPNEQGAPQVTVTPAFVSGVFKPRDTEIVSIPSMQAEERACDPKLEPYRCAVLGAVLKHGDVTEGAFPANVPTIYE